MGPLPTLVCWSPTRLLTISRPPLPLPTTSWPPTPPRTTSPRPRLLPLLSNSLLLPLLPSTQTPTSHLLLRSPFPPMHLLLPTPTPTSPLPQPTPLPPWPPMPPPTLLLEPLLEVSLPPSQELPCTR